MNADLLAWLRRQGMRMRGTKLMRFEVVVFRSKNNRDVDF